MKTENEYVEMLIEQYYDIPYASGNYLMSRYMAIQYAINDVNNTIEAIENIESKWLIGSSIKQYYNNVLKILKEKV